MKKHIRLTALLLALLMIAACGVSCASEGEGEEDTTYYSAPENPLGAALTEDNLKWGDFTYSVYGDGNVTLVNYAGTDAEVTLPSEIDGKPVISIGEACFYFVSTVKKVNIPESINAIMISEPLNRKIPIA